MIRIAIPGYRTLELEHLVLDYNGTLACDGVLIDGVKDRLAQLARELHIHVVTADTFGKARAALAGLPCELLVLPEEDQAAGKLRYAKKLGCERTVCIGNGRNDRLMLEAAALRIAVMQTEGAASESITAAHVVCLNILDALDLLSKPLRLVATLRS